jgi:protein gp37
MADNTKIEWTEATWNPITGCSVVSPGCTNCYAMRLAGTRLAPHPSRAGLTRDSKAGPVWTGEVRLNPQWLDQPLRWKRPRMIFVCAHGDLFHESVPDEWIDKVFAIMALAPQHTFQVLTKRSRRMREYVNRDATKADIRNAAEAMFGADHFVWAKVLSAGFPLPNIWLGVSAEDQARADERIPDLLATPAAVRWLSAEPLLGPIKLTDIRGTACLAETGACCGGRPFVNALRGFQACQRAGAYPFPNKTAMPRGLDWVVAGGESGQGARPMHPDWARSLRDQCAHAGVPFFFKQWGNWAPIDETYADHPVSLPLRASIGHAWTDRPELVGPNAQWLAGFGKARAGRLLDGVEHNGMPEVKD